jgi:hypothetical protein
MSPYTWQYICLLVQSHLCPVLPLNVIYMLIYLLPLSSANLPCTCFSHSMSQISCPFSLALVTYPKTQTRAEALCDTLEEAYFLWRGLVSPMTNPQYGGTPLVSCSWPSISTGCLLQLQPEDVPCNDEQDSSNTLTYLLIYGAEPFLRSCQLCSPSRTPQHFMEPEGSIPCSQEPSTGPYPEPYQSNPLHPILSLI